MSDTRSEVAYQIDPDGLLVGFNARWDSFAAENRSPELAGARIRRRPLWSFISDPETRLAHEALLQRVRSGAAISRLPFRCDSPDLRRYMEMDVALLADGNVEYRCRIIKTEARERVSFDHQRPLSGPLLRVCSWCKKASAGDDWVEIEEAIARLGLFSREHFPGITHTICDACLANLTADS